MDQSESESKNSLSEIDFDFGEENKKKFPHDRGFPKYLSKHFNNYFNATFHCLTNIYDLTSQILDSRNKDGNENPYIVLLNKIVIGNIDNKREEKEKFKDCLENLKNYIPDFNEKSDNNDPRKLIPLFLKDLKNNDILPEFMLLKYEKACTICKTVTQLEEFLDAININNMYVKFDIPKILEYTNEKKIEVLSIYDCFQFYFESIMKIEKNLECTQCHKETNQKIRINKLPDILFIFIYYGKNEKECYFENSAYKFDENINFEKYNFLHENDRKKKYFLYSLIACKNVGTDFELYYTFSRKDENSKYIIYNGSDIRKDLNVRNKMEKERIDLRDKKQSWPCVLVYKTIQE
jgi:hypothetical protein